MLLFLLACYSDLSKNEFLHHLEYWLIHLPVPLLQLVGLKVNYLEIAENINWKVQSGISCLLYVLEHCMKLEENAIQRYLTYYTLISITISWVSLVCLFQFFFPVFLG